MWDDLIVADLEEPVKKDGTNIKKKSLVNQSRIEHPLFVKVGNGNLLRSTRIARRTWVMCITEAHLVVLHQLVRRRERKMLDQMDEDDVLEPVGWGILLPEGLKL